MAITLRTETGSALSYDQLDTNFSSYFTSASLTGSSIALYYYSSSFSPTPNPVLIAIPSASKWSDISGGGISRNSNVQITGSLSQGLAATTSGSYSHAEGYTSQAVGDYSHAEGNGTTASGSYSHAEGTNTTA